MSLKKEISTFTKTRAERLGEGGVYPDETVLSIFTQMVEEHDFTQILFQFGKQYLEITLRFFETKEQYEICAEIIRHVEKYNRTKGTEIELTPW